MRDSWLGRYYLAIFPIVLPVGAVWGQSWSGLMSGPVERNGVGA